MLVRRVRIVDLDGSAAATSGSQVRDVLISDGSIAAVDGDLAPVSGVEEIDGDGRWAIPGLWDAHVHATQWVQTGRMVQLGGTTGPDDALDRLRGPLSRVATGAGSAVLGFGFRSAGWPRQPTVAELDAISGRTPVVLISGDAHNGWLNTAALALLGAPARDDAVSESEWFALLRRLDEIPGAVPSAADFVGPIADLAARGVTGLVDFEFADSFLDWPVRLAAGVGPVRVRCSVYPHQLEQVIAAGLRTGDPLPGSDGLATMGALKVITDGSLGTRTAWTREVYSDGPASTDHPCGVANYSAAELTALVRQARSAGLEVALHAIGDRANAAVLDAFAAGAGQGSVEHAQLIAQPDAERMAALGLRASVQPAHLLDDRDPTEQHWPGRADRCFALRWMQDAGVRLALGSDAPVSPLDPWLAMAAAVHRSNDEREPWNPAEALSPAESLAASTDGQGTLQVGSRGDLVLLDHDPLAPAHDTKQAAQHLRDIGVAATLVAGRPTHLTF